MRRSLSRLSHHSSSSTASLNQPLLPAITVIQRVVAGESTSVTPPSDAGLRQRQSSVVSNKSNKNNEDNTTGKMKFNMGKARALGTDVKFRPDFKFNMELALRTAVGVLLASMVQTKYRKDNVQVPSNSHEKQWVFFPEWYILGGISYVAVATVFCCGRNIGSTVREVFQQLSGVGVALLYNLLLFSVFQPQVFDTKQAFLNATNDGTLTLISHAFSGSPYYVHEGDFYTILPFIMLFTMLVLYAIGNNLFFALTLVSPNDFTNPSLPKAFGDALYKTPNLLSNLLVYSFLGILGAIIAQFMMWFPYPIFGIRKLQDQTLTCADTIQDLLNLIVDSYCFKNKDVDHMNFLRLKLKRKFDLATAKHAHMKSLLHDVWWEQLVGLHVPLRFKMSVTKPYIDLFGSLVDNLRAMTQAIQLERYERLHTLFMKSLQKQVYMIQVKATALLSEISTHVHDGHTHLDLRSLQELEKQIETLLQHFQATQTRIYKRESPSPKDVEANIPLNFNIAVSFFSNAILFVWVTFSMYIKWKDGFESYAGLVSAFTATNIMLKGCDGCAAGTLVTPTSSYSNLAQMSLGIVLFIVVELVFCPQSAIGLLRANVQQHMKLAQQAFLILFEQNVHNSGVMDQSTLDQVQEIVQKTMPALLADQAGLLYEAGFEPLLWKPPFSQAKYQAVLDCCQRLLNNTLVLFKLVTWFKFRIEQRHLTLHKKLDVEKITRKSHEAAHSVTAKEAWAFSTVELGRAIHDTFDTLYDLFGDNFMYADGDQTALFMQMKEAFRVADTDCSGEIDADEVRHMLEMVFALSGAVKVDAIDSYVHDFMEIVDADKSGKVSFDEFMDALERGLKLEVEVFQHRSKKVVGLASIAEGGEAGGVEGVEGAPVDNDHHHHVVLQVGSGDVRSAPSPRTHRVSSGGASPLTRSHDMLNVDSFSLLEISQTMRTTYAQWLMEKNRFERVTMEELLLLNCLISGVSGIARNLALLEEMTVQQ
ncbi:hypothetical protein DYB37_005483 [Aphanomyces astaci]|uniref:EF-hand domain-containing protein n=1 Tax=Aphanomyces astaci TaxID=112090 RepID=A0A3R7B0T1_APHAT|nr:hypothetical protein DYB37_005483 [Aphanomyces astaci]